MGCCSKGKAGNRSATNIKQPAGTRTKLSKLPTPGKRKDRRAQGIKR